MRVESYSQEIYKGPLPHPDILRGYEDVCPGAAKDIIQSFIKEGDSRRKLQERETAMCEEWARADIKLQNQGQVLGFIIAISGVIGGLIVASTGAPAAGGVVSSASLAAIVVAFLRQRNMKEIKFGEDAKEPPDEKADAKTE